MNNYIVRQGSSKTVILLTATVTPNVSSRLSVINPDLRLSQYQQALLSWQDALDPRLFELAVVETSGASESDLLAALSAKDRSRVRVLRHLPTASQIERGKGAIELAAVFSAIDSMPDLVAGSTLYKSTGRLNLLNSARILSPLRPATVRVRMTADRSWADTRIFGADLATWKMVFGGVDFQVDDRSNRYLEKVVASRVSSAAALGDLQLSRFPRRPVFSGVSGSTGARYSSQSAIARGLIFDPIEGALARIASKKQV